MDDKLTTILAELRRRFEVLYGTRMVQMMLFGSQARGDAEPGSDIDILVVLRGEVSPCEEIARTIEDVADVCCTTTKWSPMCSYRLSNLSANVVLYCSILAATVCRYDARARRPVSSGS